MNPRELAGTLRNAGIGPGDDLLIHSSFRALQPFEGTPSDLIDLLLESIGPDGNLMLPAFNYSKPLPEPFFDPATTPARTGTVVNTGLRRRDAVRSLHPTHSVAVIGPGADSLTRDHLQYRAFGVGSPIDRLAARGGKILLLGVGQTSNSTLHVAEEHAGVPKEHPERTLPTAKVKLPSGEIVDHRLDSSHSCSAAFEAAALPLRRAGLVRDTIAGSCLIQIMNGGDVIRRMLETLRDDPATLLCNNPACESCRITRGNLKARASLE